MVTINLLPWRENKLKRMRRNFFVQTLSLLSLTFVLSGFLWAKNTSLIESQLDNLMIIKADNREMFSHLESFQSAQQVYLTQQQKIKKINQLISERQMIPQLLGLLENKKLSFQVDYLSITHKSITLKGKGNSSGSVLSLLNALREESVLCQVTFIPFETTQTASTIEFELQAKICNEYVD